MCIQACKSGELLVSLPRSCQLSYDGSTEPNLLQLISKVPDELWGAKLALQVQHLLTTSVTAVSACQIVFQRIRCDVDMCTEFAQ